jgi:hypothetical protein
MWVEFCDSVAKLMKTANAEFALWRGEQVWKYYVSREKAVLTAMKATNPNFDSVALCFTVATMSHIVTRLDQPSNYKDSQNRMDRQRQNDLLAKSCTLYVCLTIPNVFH